MTRWTRALAVGSLLAAATVSAAPEPAATASAAAGPDTTAVAPAPADSARGWGKLPPRRPEHTAVFPQPERPDWEAALMPVYHGLGLPFRIVWFVGDQAVTGLDRMGVFDLPPAEYAGLPGPYGTYIMPVFSIESLEGTKFGIDVLRPHFLGEDALLHLRASTTTRQAQMAGLGVLAPLGPRWQMQLGGGSEEIQAVRYYGLGPGTRFGDESYYYRRVNWAGAELDRALGERFALVGRAFWSKVRAREPRVETDESLETIHDELPPGYPGESNGWTLRLSLRYDTTRERARPESGTFGTASASFFEDSDGGGLRYVQHRVELERYFPLWHTKRTLAVRGFWNRIHNQGPAEVPFTRLVTFTSPDELRGFGSMRWYGLGSLGVSLEYRWPIWIVRNRDGPGLDAYLFSDNGQVFMDTREIAWRNLEFTGGVGFRLLGDEGRYVARFELGLSDEDVVVRFKFNQNFQDDRRVLYDVKDPTRYR